MAQQSAVIVRMASTAIINWAILLPIGGVCESLGAESASSKADLTRLLELGWQRSAEAVKLARAEYDRLKQIHPSDARIDYALGLVLTKQMRYADAALVLKKVVASEPELLAARLLYAWTLVITKQYDAACVEIKQIAESLSGLEKTADATALDNAAAVLGRLVGFMEQVATSQIGDLTSGQLRRDTVARLGPARGELFDRARIEVVDRYSSSQKSAEEGRKIAEKEAAEEKERQLEQLNQQIESAEQAVSAAQGRYDQVQSEVNEELREIRVQQQTLLAERRRVEGEAASVRREIIAIDSRIAELLRLADGEDDAARRQWYLNEAARWRGQRATWEARLLELERAARSIIVESQSLTRQAELAQGRLDREAKALTAAQQSAARLRQQSARLAGQRVSGGTAEVLDLERRRIALTTYVPLPVSLEEERTRLLAIKP